MIGKEGARRKRQVRIRKKIVGCAERPRLSVFRSLRHFHAQLIDDREGKTLIGLSTQSKEFQALEEASRNAGNLQGAKELGRMLAKKATGLTGEAKISQVVFDRGGFLYHGRVKAFAEGAREGGLKF